MNVVKMAWRNVWRNSRRSMVTIAAMTLALVVELLYSGLVVGMVSGMEQDIIDTEVGDIQIYNADYLEQPSLHNTIAAPGPLVAALEANGFPVSPLLVGGGLVAHGEFSSGVSLQGLDVARDAQVSRISSTLSRGAWLDASDPKGVVIGAKLARTLGVDLGGELVVLSQATDGSTANDLYTVRGVMGSVSGSADRGTLFMTAPAFRELMVMPEGAHKLVVRRPKGMSLEEADTQVEALVADIGTPLDVKTWKDLFPIIAQMLDSMGGMIVFLYLIIYVAVAILILNAVLMAVFERIREFGVLKAIGVGPLQVGSMIVLEGMFQACVASVLGVVIALPLMWYLSVYGINVGSLGGMDMMGMALPPVWRGVYTLDTVKVPVILLFVIVAAAVAYPAFKAARIRPIEAMTYQG